MTLTQREIDAAFSRLPEPTDQGVDECTIHLMRPESEAVIKLTFVKERVGLHPHRWALSLGGN